MRAAKADVADLKTTNLVMSDVNRPAVRFAPSSMRMRSSGLGEDGDPDQTNPGGREFAPNGGAIGDVHRTDAGSTSRSFREKAEVRVLRADVERNAALQVDAERANARQDARVRRIDAHQGVVPHVDAVQRGLGRDLERVCVGDALDLRRRRRTRRPRPSRRRSDRRGDCRSRRSRPGFCRRRD